LNQDINTPAEIDLKCQDDKKRYDFSNKTYINKEGVVCWSFGKNINKSVLEDMGYLEWVLKNEFPLELKNKLKQLKA
jgi:hypothetical protein